MNLTNTFKRHILNFSGKRLDKKYIVFESDDWGSERIPSGESLKYLTSCGIDVYSNPFNYLDSLETGDDLSALFEVLLIFNDRHGNHPVITANSVTANPDFDKIRASGYSRYHYENILQSYNKKKACLGSYTTIREGINSGIFHPQFHGREHLNIKQWLSALNSGGELWKKVFDAGIYAIDIKSESSGRPNLTAAFDGSSEQDSFAFKSIIEKGVNLFKDLFGFVPHSFAAPCYIWHRSLESILLNSGIKYIQGLPFQYSPSNNNKYRKIYHFQGQKNSLDQTYFIRNCFFEPALNSRFDWVADCLRRIKIIFFRGKPAVMGTHRINFIGSLNETNRTKNLEQFSILLKMILKTWPDVEFITTDRLGEIYSKLNHS
jgi:hypothetical protein